MFVVEYVAGVICVVLSQIVLAGAFAGIGLAVRRTFGLTTPNMDDVFTAFWLGFSAIVVGLMLWHFVLPVTVVVLMLALLVGAAGFLMSRRDIAAAFASEGWRTRRGWLLAMVIVALYVANQGVADLTYSDSALYHLQAVAWNKSYALVPGLANLYGPLGFNNASLLYGAMLDVGPWGGLGHRLANGLLLQVLALRVIIAVARIASQGRRAAGNEVFLVTLIPAVVALSLLGRLSSYATATATAIVVLVIAERLYALLTVPREARETAYGVFCITTLSAIAVTLKLSAVVFAAPVTLVVLGVWLRRRARDDGMRRRTFAYALGAALLIGGAWMTRSVILSGYPLFPSTVAAMPVDWRTSTEHADAEYALAAHSAKASTMLVEVVAGRNKWGWLPRWWRISIRDPFDFIIPLGIALFSGVALLWARRRPPPPSAFWMLPPTLIAALAWFFLAPEGRYAIGFFWALAGLAVAEWWRIAPSSDAAPRRVVPVAIFASVSTLVIVPALHIPLEAPGSAGKTLVKSVIRMWDSGGWYNQIAQPKLMPYRTASGLMVSVPEDRCWSAPVPCTPNPASTLELRDATNIRRGFRVRGAWAMEDWPFKSRPDFLRAWRESRPR